MRLHPQEGGMRSSTMNTHKFQKEKVKVLCSMGFLRDEAQVALKASNGNVHQAAMTLISMTSPKKSRKPPSRRAPEKTACPQKNRQWSDIDSSDTMGVSPRSQFAQHRQEESLKENKPTEIIGTHLTEVFVEPNARTDCTSPKSVTKHPDVSRGYHGRVLEDGHLYLVTPAGAVPSDSLMETQPAPHNLLRTAKYGLNRYNIEKQEPTKEDEMSVDPKSIPNKIDLWKSNAPCKARPLSMHRCASEGYGSDYLVPPSRTDYEI